MGLLAALAAVVAAGGCAADRSTAAGSAPPPAPPAARKLAAFTQTIEGSTATIDMAPIPFSTNPDADPLWMSTTEVTWDLFDVWVFALDQPDPTQPADADAVSRPSKPYLPPDRGFGHAGYPALSMTRHAAEEFCVWLTSKTGRKYRLPTVEEWRFACRAEAFGTMPEPAHAWTADNSDRKTHAVRSLAPNPFGLYDMIGNVGEWVMAEDGSRIIVGGSYADAAADCGCDASKKQSYTWNESDPQIPKSRWWLADAPFVGFRVVCEGDRPRAAEGGAP